MFLVFQLDSNAGVNNFYLQVLIILFWNWVPFFVDRNEVLDLTLLGELEGIWLQTDQNLNDPLLIRVYDGTLRFKTVFKIVRLNILKLQTQVDILFISLFLLHSYNLLNRFNNINLADDLPELICLDLCVVKQILNCKVHQVTRVVLNSDVLY